jgi:ubiquinone/menaquinone biosynthesis C-methylase UbiE
MKSGSRTTDSASMLHFRIRRSDFSTCLSMHYRAIADYYDAEYEQNDMLQRDVPFFLGHLPKKRQQVLELACGTGRAAIPLAQAGHRVVGVDYAADVIELARQKRDSVGVGERDVELVQQDVLHLDLGDRRFDWIAIFFNTLLNFTTLDQLDALLTGVRNHLKPRGRFWLDIFQPNLDLIAQEHSEHLEPSTFYVPHLNRTVYRETEVRRDASRQVQHITYHYRWFDAGGVEQRETVAFDLTFLFPRELHLLLERNGLEIDTLYGDHDGSTLAADSPRIIACCRPRRGVQSGHV